MWKWTLLAAAACLIGWVSVLFHDRGKPTFPGAGLPPAGFGLIALVAYVQAAGIGVLAAISIQRPELGQAPIFLLGLSLFAIAMLSSVSVVFVPSKLARAGIWFGWIGFASLVVSVATTP